MNLQQRRIEVEAELEDLRRQRGAAKLDGQMFAQQQQLNRLQHELDSLVAAEGIHADRERADDESKRLQRLAALRSELTTLEEGRLEAIEMAEAAARNLVDSLNRAMLTTARMTKVAYLISGDSTPLPMLRNETENRFAGRLAGVLCLLNSVGRHRFGHLQFVTSLYPAADNWREKEEAVLRHHLQPLIGGEQTEGTSNDAIVSLDARRRAAECPAAEGADVQP